MPYQREIYRWAIVGAMIGFVIFMTSLLSETETRFEDHIARELGRALGSMFVAGCAGMIIGAIKDFYAGGKPGKK
jgi:hypothetical protein